MGGDVQPVVGKCAPDFPCPGHVTLVPKGLIHWELKDANTDNEAVRGGTELSARA